MGKKKSYYEKLKDPRWQKKRLEVLERDNFTCRGCGDKEKTLHVHHGFYDNSYKDPWKYPTPSLWTLCKDCHRKSHNPMHDMHLEMARINPMRLKELYWILRDFRESLGEDGNHELYNFKTGEYVPSDFFDDEEE